MSVVLYDYWRSSAAYRLRIALGLLEIPHQIVPVNLLAGEHRGPENLARNPQGLVPSLEIDGRTMTQSLSILEYLDETRHAGFLPDDPAGRQRVRALSYAIAMEIHPVCNLSVAKYAAEHSGGALSMQGWMQQFIPRGLAGVERMLGDGMAGTFCHGDGISMADICLVPQIYNARRWDVALTPYPRTCAIMANLEDVAAVRAAHPDKHKPDD